MPGSPATHAARAERWLKSDYAQRLKLDDDLRSLGDELLDAEQRERLASFSPGISEMPRSGLAGIIPKGTAIHNATTAATPGRIPPVSQAIPSA